VQAAYLGPEASFSHQAAIDYFGSGNDTELVPCSSFGAILARNASEDVACYGVIPVENSFNGSVVQALDLLRDTDGLRIGAEVYLPIRHQLLSLAKDLSQVRQLSAMCRL